MRLCCQSRSATGALTYALSPMTMRLQWFFQEFATDSQVADAGRSQFEIKDEATFRDQHM